MSTRLNNSEIVYLTHEELKSLIGSITDKRDKALFLLAYRYGLRASEVGLLRRDDLDFKSLRIKLRRVKRGLGGEYPLDPDVGPGSTL